MCQPWRTLLIKRIESWAMAAPESKSLENGRLLGPDETLAPILGAEALGEVTRA